MIKNTQLDMEIEGIGVEYSGKFYGFSRGEFGKRPRDVMGRIINIGRELPRCDMH